jgi:H+-transporting ATPase
LQPIGPPQEETEESLNSLIDDLVAEDGRDSDLELLTLVPDKDNAYDPVMIETAVNRGLTDDEVAERRKNYGWNRLTQDKPNHLIKFLMFFMGPIQWVMEVSRMSITLVCSTMTHANICLLYLRPQLSSLVVCKTG